MRPDVYELFRVRRALDEVILAGATGLQGDAKLNPNGTVTLAFTREDHQNFEGRQPPSLLLTILDGATICYEKLKPSGVRGHGADPLHGGGPVRRG